MIDDQGREYKVVTYEPAQANDSSGDPVQISCDYSSDDRYYVGVTTVTITVTGSNDITATCSFNIQVVSNCKYVLLFLLLLSKTVLSYVIYWNFI